MIALFARVSVKPGSVDRFLKFLEADFRGSLLEEGCVKFEVSRDRTDSSVFHLYEVYVDDAAYERHKAAPYLQAMFTQAGDTFAAPPELHVGTPMWPGEAGYWSKAR